jgi:hypothetical protein
MSFYYEVVVDTDQYAGNFEREMASFVFGCFDVNRVGAEYVEQGVFPLPWACSEHEAYASVIVAHDREGRGELYEKFGNIAPTPGFRNNGMGKHFPYTEGEAIEGNFYPAYLSVSFRFQNGFEPSAEQLAELKARVLEFPEVYTPRIKTHTKPTINITGFRLLKTELSQAVQSF